MNIVTDNFDIDRCGVEVFKLQFAYATTGNSVSPAGIEGINIKMFRPFAHFFIRGKGDANITMRHVFLLQYRQRGHDFCNTGFDSSKDGQEQYVGFDVTLAKYIAEYIGVDLVIEPMSFDACQTAVYTGSVPMSISGYSWTEERSENYEISDYYYAGDNETEQVILIKKTDADKYTSAEDFSGVDVGAQNASLQMNLLTSQLPDANPITIGDLGIGVLELQNGSIEALAVAKGNAEMILDSNPDLMICPWEFEVAAEYEANIILITKGETALLNTVNEALAMAYADGLYGTWYEDAVALAKSENAAEVSVED